MRQTYKTWLEEQKYSPNTVTAQLHRVSRVEEYYGDLEQLLINDTLQSVLDELTYSVSDERRSRPNPSKIPFEGNTRNNLASYRNAVARYADFLKGAASIDQPSVGDPNIAVPVRVLADLSDASEQRLSLERDMQIALRRDISALGPTLSILDDGAERSVESGFIDITCLDAGDNAIVVIELKAGKADGRAIGQVLGYMGDIAIEEEGRTVRGILVANEFDRRTISAARVVPSLRLVRYSISFRFENES